MSDVDVFVIDDDFDPLADLSLDDGERFARVTPSEFASLTDEALSPAPDAPRELPTKVLYNVSTV